MSDLKAIHPKHQATVNRALFHLIKHNEANDLWNKYDGEGDIENMRTQASICEKRFHRYEDITSELPKREVNNIESSKFY
jgi:hypothetical protein